MPRTSLTAAPLLARNTLWNLGGQLAPMLVALVAIPPLVSGLGVERFGILALAWMVVGYASLFDLGIGRALTKLVAERLGGPAQRAAEIPALVGTALALLAGLGVVGGVAVVAGAPWLARDALNVPPALVPETVSGLYLLAVSVPAVVLTAAYRGVLEAHQRFGLVNAIRVPLGAFTFAGPALALPFSSRLDVVVAVLVAGRVVATWVHHAACLRAVPGLRGALRADRALVRPLLALGGWMTVSNVVSPLMVYLDRFVVGGLLTASAVAYYVTPYEIVTKLWLVPGALVGVLFPAFSTALATDPARAAALFGRGQRLVLAAMLPATGVVALLAAPGLRLWLGEDFARESTRVLQWLAAGVLVNSLAHLPFALIQGAGRADLTAKLHLVELPFYLAVMAWGVPRHGIVGVAAIWTLRAAADTAVLTFVARRLLRRASASAPLPLATAAGASGAGGAGAAP